MTDIKENWPDRLSGQDTRGRTCLLALLHPKLPGAVTNRTTTGILLERRDSDGDPTFIALAHSTSSIKIPLSLASGATMIALANNDVNKMKIGIFGGSGFIGHLLAERLKRSDEVMIFDRRAPICSGVDFQEIDVLKSVSPPMKLSGCHVVINLCGQPIFGSPKSSWEQIYSSRVDTTKRIVDWLNQMSDKPLVFICANAVGYYGNGGERVLTEASPPGTSRMSRLCQDWQTTAEEAEKYGVRTVVMRQGMVISPTGGALAGIRPLFKLGLGATIGDRQTWISWIGWQDLTAAYLKVIEDSTVVGPVNLVSPEPLRQREFVSVIAKAWHRPAVWRLPKFIGRLVLGTAIEEIIASRRVLPKKLLDHSFHFSQEKLASAAYPLEV